MVWWTFLTHNICLVAFFSSHRQGNMDPGVLYGSKATIAARVMDVIKKARSQGVRCGLT